jgi:ABC-2 type transport system ATP-binding protein
MDEAERCTHVSFMDAGRFAQSGTPAEIKASVPGTLYEVAASPQREAVEELAALPGARSAHVLGEVVRVLADENGPDEPAMRRALEAAGIEVSRVRRTPIDMEAAFAFLAEAGDAS